jgi:hypothetical protein
MIVRHVCGTSAAALFTVTMAAFAQTSQPTPSSAQAASDSQSGTPITLVGCVQREADYRRAADAGRGGAAATGVALGNEYVLVNASNAGAASSAGATADCSAASGGQAYELTGKGEGDLERYVGKRVELVGMLKRGDSNTPVGTSGVTPDRPSGGFDPLGQDLRIPEVELTSVREFAAAPAAAPAAVPPEPTPQAQTPAPQQQPERADPPVSPQIELPRTASPIPLAGLAGMLALGAAAGLRAYRRRR